MQRAAYVALAALFTACATAHAQQPPPAAGSPPTRPSPSGADARNPGVIQLLNQIEGLQAEINRLLGQIEVLGNGLENAQKRQRDMYLDLDTRLRRIERPGAGAASPRTEGPPQQKPEGPPQQRAEGPPQQRSDTAQRLEMPTSPEIDTRLRRLEQQTGADVSRPRDGGVDVEARIKRLEQLLAGQGNQPTSQVTGAPPVTPTPSATVAAPAAPTRPVPPTSPTASANVAPSTAADAGPARKAYDLGLSAYRSGDYQGAIASFDSIVKRYPRDPLAPNAQYWIGDTWFNLRDFRSAVTAQQALVTNYPDSPKIPDALLNLSSAYAALGESANARRTLEDLIARFPQTDAAEKARQRLVRLK